LRKRHETKDMKIILLASLYDKSRYRREPDSLHGADAYIEEYQIESSLIQKVKSLKRAAPEGLPERKEDAGEDAGRSSEGKAKEPEVTGENAPQPAAERAKGGLSGEPVEKARRLARTIVSDIYLYSRAKVEEAIKKDSFHTAFAAELREGLKLYETRIPADVRKLGDFFNEELATFIEKKKRDKG